MMSSEPMAEALTALMIADLEAQRQEALQSLARIDKALAALGKPAATPRRFRVDICAQVKTEVK